MTAARGSLLRAPASFSKSSGTAEGTAVKIASGICADAVGNSNPGIDSAAFKIDLTAPTVSVGGVTLNAIYDRGAVPVCDLRHAGRSVGREGRGDG